MGEIIRLCVNTYDRADFFSLRNRKLLAVPNFVSADSMRMASCEPPIRMIVNLRVPSGRQQTVQTLMIIAHFS